MNTKPARTTLAVLVAGAVVATPLTFALGGAAQADTERSGAISGGGRYELTVDREDGGFEIGADLDDVAAGSRWKIVLRQDGKRFVNQVLTADGEGDLDLERYRADTAGTDTFVMVATRVDGTKQRVRAGVTR